MAQSYLISAVMEKESMTHKECTCTLHYPGVIVYHFERVAKDVSHDYVGTFLQHCFQISTVWKDSPYGNAAAESSVKARIQRGLTLGILDDRDVQNRLLAFIVETTIASNCIPHWDVCRLWSSRNCSFKWGTSLFLASETTDYMTGAVLVIDG